MPSSDRATIGLFPLGLVLLPGEALPLHIFEPRYQRLLADVREGGEFGIVARDEESVAAVGCTAVVLDVSDELEDGSADILVEGRRRFTVVDVRVPEDPLVDYLQGVVEFFDDDIAEQTASETGEDLPERVGELYLQVVTLVDGEPLRTPPGDEPLSFMVAAALDLGLALKQQLLECRSEDERLITLTAVMEALIPRLELRLEREDAIRGNGKGH